MLGCILHHYRENLGFYNLYNPHALRKTKRLFDNIVVLRAFAALLVTVYHIIEKIHWINFPITEPWLIFRIGWIGVDLFFVISGFVITYSALTLYKNNAQTFGSIFVARRLSRILPLYLLTGALWLVFCSPGFFTLPILEWLRHIVSHLLFINCFWPETHGSIDGANWTVALEMQFYLALMLLIKWINKTSCWRIILYCTLIAWSWRLAIFLWFGTSEINFIFIHVTQLPGTLDEFGAGILLAKLLHDPNSRRFLKGYLCTGLTVIFGIICMGIYWAHSSYWDIPAMVVFWHTFVAIFFFWLLAAATTLPQFTKKLLFRPFHYLGEISYGIYLWHLFAIEFCLQIANISPFQSLIVILSITVLLSISSWECFERFLHLWGGKKLAQIFLQIRGQFKT